MGRKFCHKFYMDEGERNTVGKSGMCATMLTWGDLADCVRFAKSARSKT